MFPLIQIALTAITIKKSKQLTKQFLQVQNAAFFWRNSQGPNVATVLTLTDITEEEEAKMPIASFHMKSTSYAMENFKRVHIAPTMRK